MTPKLLVCAPLWYERWSLRDGLAERTLLRRTGLGPRRSARSVNALAAAEFDALVIAGLAGGVGEGVRSGDIVVGNEIRGRDTTFRCPSAPLLAGELQRRGFEVHCGSIVSLGHVVHGRERTELACSGALAVDMESSELAMAAGARPLVPVRVITDTADEPLARLTMARRTMRALRRLGSFGPALEDWAHSAARRRIVLPRRTLALDESDGSSRRHVARSHGSDEFDIGCPTANQSTAARAVAGRIDVLFVLDAANSSNSRRLVEIARRSGTRAHLVSDVGEVRLEWLHGVDTVGITAGASAPPPLVDELVDALRGLGSVEVTEPRTAEENIQFGLPKEVSG